MEFDPVVLMDTSQEIEHHHHNTTNKSRRSTSDTWETLLDRRHSPTYIDLDDASSSWRGEYTPSEYYVQYVDERSKAEIRKAELAELRSRRNLVKQKEVFDTDSSASGSSTISATTLAAFFSQQRQVHKQIRKSQRDSLDFLHRYNSGEVKILTPKIENQKESPYLRTSPDSAPLVSSPSSPEVVVGSSFDFVQKGNTRKKVITYNNKYYEAAAKKMMEAVVEEGEDGVIVLHPYDAVLSSQTTVLEGYSFEESRQRMIFHFDHDTELRHVNHDENQNPTLCMMAVSPTTSEDPQTKKSDAFSSIHAEIEYMKLEVQAKKKTFILSGDGLRPETAYVVVESQTPKGNSKVIEDDPTSQKEDSSSQDAATATTTSDDSHKSQSDDEEAATQTDDTESVHSDAATVLASLTDDNIVLNEQDQQHSVINDPKAEKDNEEESSSSAENNSPTTLKVLEEPNDDEHLPEEPPVQEEASNGGKERKVDRTPDQKEIDKSESLQVVISDSNLLEDDASTELATILASPQEEETGGNDKFFSTPRQKSRLIPPKQSRSSLASSPTPSHESPTNQSICLPVSESKRRSRVPRARSSGLPRSLLESNESPTNQSICLPVSESKRRSRIPRARSSGLSRPLLDSSSPSNRSIVASIDVEEDSVYSKASSIASSSVGRWSLGMAYNNRSKKSSLGRRSLNSNRLVRVPLYVGLSKERLERRQQLKCCDGTYIPKLHHKTGGCERCLYWASDEEKQQFKTSGHQIRIMMVRGGCHRNCKIFPRKKNEHPVRLCRKCFFDTHQGQQH